MHGALHVSIITRKFWQYDVVGAATSGTSSNRTDAEREAPCAYYLLDFYMLNCTFEAVINFM